MRFEILILIVLLALVAVSCAGPRSHSRPANGKNPLIAQAEFDLNCPARKLKWHRLNDTTGGVRGCGRQATYTRVCQDRLDNTASFFFGVPLAQRECQFILNYVTEIPARDEAAKKANDEDVSSSP